MTTTAIACVKGVCEGGIYIGSFLGAGTVIDSVLTEGGSKLGYGVPGKEIVERKRIK